MYKSRTSRIIPIILIILITIVLIGAVSSVIRALFNPSGASVEQKVDTSKIALLSTVDSAGVRATVRGPIVANERFRSYKIEVTPSSRTIVTYTGYLDQVLQKKTYPNNTQAYEEFVYALDKANFMLGKELSNEKNDTRGICATGKVYEFTLLDDANIVKNLWTSTCKGSPGSFTASVKQNMNLFIKQIPDAQTVLRASGF